MRFLYFTLIGIVLYNCSSQKGNNEKTSTPDSAKVAANDTFNLVYGSHLKIPTDIYLDTVYKKDKHKKFEMTVITPSLSGESFASINTILLKEIKRKEEKYISIDINGLKDDVDNVNISIEPINIYKSNKIISYAFVTYYSDAQLMRPFRTFFSVNYDLQKNRVIYLTDYFNVLTMADSLSLSNVIYSAVDERGGLGAIGYDRNYVFAIDNDNVYFYFDQGGVGGNPTGLEGSAKKKYIVKLIKDEYR